MGTANVVSTFDPSALFAGEPPVRQRAVTLLSGSNAVGAVTPRGTVLGRITATDKYQRSVATANDGSQNPVAILAVDTDASAVDVSTPAYFEGEFAYEKLTVDASWSLTTLRNAFRIALSAIFIRSIGVLG